MVDQSPLKSSFDSSFLKNYNEFCKTLMTKIIDLIGTHPLMCHLSQKKLITLTKNAKWRWIFVILKKSRDFIIIYEDFCDKNDRSHWDASIDVSIVTKKLIKLTKNPKWRLDFRYYEEISRFYHYLWRFLWQKWWIS